MPDFRCNSFFNFPVRENFHHNGGKNRCEWKEDEPKSHIENCVRIGYLPCDAGTKRAGKIPDHGRKIRYPENEQQNPGNFKNDMGQCYPFCITGCTDTGKRGSDACPDICPQNQGNSGLQGDQFLLCQNNDDAGKRAAALNKGCKNSTDQ